MPKKKRRKIYNRDYIINIHILLFFRTYYGDFSIKKFKRYLTRIKTRRIDYVSKIIFLLESRLDILLYRLNFFKNPREARTFIKSKSILINNNLITKLNYQMYINDVMSINSKYKKFLYKQILNKLNKKYVLFNYPKYLEVNYKLLKSIFILYPKKKNIPSIMKLNLSFLRT
jgi:small subunit ribosomal protein S4